MATAQDIISNFLNSGGFGQPFPQEDLNAAGVWRNPLFDLRTEQELAGELDPTALYPNPQLDFAVQEPPPDPCQEGFMLVDGICQPIEQFGQSSYDEKQDRDDRDEEERDYFSIEEMKKLDDYELLKYLDDGWLKGDSYKTTIGGNFMPSWFSIPFGKQNEKRRNFIIQELQNRGYNMTTNDKGDPTFNLGNALGIISNAEAANKGGNKLATDQISIFTPDEINYQIQAKKEADKVVQQGGNPYGQSFSGTPEQIHQQVVQDAIQSGGTVNPFEAQGINQPQVQQPQYTGVNPFKDEGVWI